MVAARGKKDWVNSAVAGTSTHTDRDKAHPMGCDTSQRDGETVLLVDREGGWSLLMGGGGAREGGIETRRLALVGRGPKQVYRLSNRKTHVHQI